MRFALLGLSITLALSACKKEESKATPAPGSAAVAGGTAKAGPAMKDGARIVPIDVVMEGYRPERIPGKPGEKLLLVFTRKVDGECFEEVKVPGGELVKLPKNQPKEIAVTVPMDGEVKFACGMNMIEGSIIAEKG